MTSPHPPCPPTLPPYPPSPSALACQPTAPIQLTHLASSSPHPPPSSPPPTSTAAVAAASAASASAIHAHPTSSSSQAPSSPPLATPKRPPRTPRTYSIDASRKPPSVSTAAPTHHQHAQPTDTTVAPLTLASDELHFDHDQTPRKSHYANHHSGIPTPLNSESTASGSGSAIGTGTGTGTGTGKGDATRAGGGGGAGGVGTSAKTSTGVRGHRYATSAQGTGRRRPAATLAMSPPPSAGSNSSSPEELRRQVDELPGGSDGSESPPAPTTSASSRRSNHRGSHYEASSSSSSSPSPFAPTPKRVVQRQSSTATIRTSGSRDTDDSRSPRTPSVAPVSTEPERTPLSATSTYRKRRSALHERDVSEIRSESRLGRHRQDEDDELRNTVRPRPATLGRNSTLRSTHGESSTATDTSGTEGAATTTSASSTTGRRLRKKGSAGSIRGQQGGGRARRSETSRSRQSATTGAGLDDEWELDSRSSEVSGRERGGGADYGYVKRVMSPQMVSARPLPPSRRGSISAVRDRRTSQTSDASLSHSPEDHLQLFPTTGASRTPARSPLPSDFMAGADEFGTIAGSSGRRNQEAVSSRPASYRRRRYVSEASAPGDIPTFEYAGRAGTQGSRLSVDASSATRHLARSRHSDRPTPVGLEWEPGLASTMAAATSPSELARQRKVSSSSASGVDLHYRSVSRASYASRRSHGRDVFDDEARSPLGVEAPASSSHFSPSGRLDRVRALRQRRDEVRRGKMDGDHHASAELDDLRYRIDELGMRSDSRTPSRASLNSQTSRSTSSVRRYDALAADARPTARLLQSEPRRDRPPAHGRAAQMTFYDDHDGEAASQTIDLAEFRARQAARLGGARGAGDTIGLRSASYHVAQRTPSTPDLVGTRSVHSAVVPTTSRFPSGGGAGMCMDPALGSSSAADEETTPPSSQPPELPRHERNLYNAFSIFDRHFTSGPGTPSSSSTSLVRGVGVGGAGGGGGSSSESSELVSRFRHVTDSAAHMNAELRALIQITIEAQIDAELGEASGKTMHSAVVESLGRIDRALSQLLRSSDEQLRSLTDGLIAFTRAERERDRLRKVMNSDSGSVGGGRPGSRLSTLNMHHASPEKQERGEARAPPATSHEAAETLSNGRAAAVAAANVRRATSVREAPSPSPAGGADAVGGASELGHASMRIERSRRLVGTDAPPPTDRYAGRVSPTAHRRHLTAAGAAEAMGSSPQHTHHARAASETVGPRDAVRYGGGGGGAKTSSTSVATVRPPALSSPVVSTTTVSSTPVRAAARHGDDDDDDGGEGPVALTPGSAASWGGSRTGEGRTATRAPGASPTAAAANEAARRSPAETLLRSRQSNLASSAGGGGGGGGGGVAGRSPSSETAPSSSSYRLSLRRRSATSWGAGADASSSAAAATAAAVAAGSVGGSASRRISREMLAAATADGGVGVGSGSASASRSASSSSTVAGHGPGVATSPRASLDASRTSTSRGRAALTAATSSSHAIEGRDRDGHDAGDVVGSPMTAERIAVATTKAGVGGGGGGAGSAFMGGATRFVARSLGRGSGRRASSQILAQQQPQ